MKWHFLLLITIHFSLFTLKVAGQNKPCNNFDCAYKKAENFLKQAAYQKALDNLDSAEDYLTDANTAQKEQIKQLRRRLFVAIDIRGGQDVDFAGGLGAVSNFESFFAAIQNQQIGLRRASGRRGIFVDDNNILRAVTVHIFNQNIILLRHATFF